MNGRVPLFLLKLDDQRYALRLPKVVRVVRMVEVTPMPNAQAGVLGLINVQGEVLPVIDLRGCFGHGNRDAEPQDVLVIVDSGGRKAALAADAVAGVVEFPEQALVPEESMLQHPDYVEGVVKVADGLVLVCDLDKLLALCSHCPSCGEVGQSGPSALRGQGRRRLEGEAPERAGARGEEALRLKALLKERAEKLAREPAGEPGDLRHEVVEFLLSGEHYAIKSAHIREVYPLKEFTPLPCTPGYVLGIVNIRGKILSLIDMRKFFELPEQGLSDLNKVIVVYRADMEFGILADAIVGVRTLQGRELQPSLPTLTGIRAEYLKGVTGERLVVLDAGKLLADRTIVVHEEA